MGGEEIVEGASDGWCDLSASERESLLDDWVGGGGTFVGAHACCLLSKGKAELEKGCTVFLTTTTHKGIVLS